MGHHGSQSNSLEYGKFAAVLMLIAGLAYFAATLGVDDAASVALNDYLRWFMGVFLVTFAGFKFAGYAMFVAMYPGYDLVAKRSKAYAYAYPFIELLLGMLYIFDAVPDARHIATIVIMGVSSLGVFNEVFVTRKGIHCACLGNIIKLPLSTVSLVENTSMVAMACYMLFVL